MVKKKRKSLRKTKSLKVFKIYLTNRWLYTLAVLVIILTLGVSVIAYNSGAVPNVFGHSSEEMEVDVDPGPGENIKTLQAAIDAGDFGGGGTGVTSPACTLCKTSCGGDWPNQEGRFQTDDDFEANPAEMRDVSCTGSVIDRSQVGVNIALCCK